MTSESAVMLQYNADEDLADERVGNERVANEGLGGQQLSAADGHGVSLMHQFHRASQVADELFVAELKDCKLTPRQFVVLAAAAANVGTSQTQIVKVTGIDRSTIADIIRRMVKLKLLSRKRTKDDARAYSVSVTDYGHEILTMAEQAAIKVDQALLKRLTPQGAEELQKSMASLAGDGVGV